jgi:hypothetical protein
MNGYRQVLDKGGGAARSRPERRPFSGFLPWYVVGLLCLAHVLGHSGLADEASIRKALESITQGDLKRHIETLADDTFEGREAGSRGGRAAGVYIGKELQKLYLPGAGEDQGYYQSFDGLSRNVLAWIEGSDPLLKREVLIVSAHYDHVGYGNQQNSYGPVGRIHNGADDNASGIAGLLEIIEALVQLRPAPQRSILFAFWDGEEKGLLGSQYWIDHPTVALDRVACVLNMDMIGRLRGERVEVYGTRTASGMRQLFSRANAGEGLLLDFTWEMKANSDHHTFFARGVPAFMLHTYLHEDYHRPSDDADTIDFDGVQRVARVVFHAVRELADAPRLPAFRTASRVETPEQRQMAERPLAPLPGRLGIEMRTEAGVAGLLVSRVTPRSVAERAGLRVGDRVIRFGGRDVADTAELQRLVLAADGPQRVTIERPDQTTPLELTVTLSGTPVRIGINWRLDDAEPGTAIVTRVVPGSPAERAGIAVNDRLWEVSGQTFSGHEELLKLLTTLPGPLHVIVECSGRVKTVTVEPAQTSPPVDVPPTSE